jgi:hypothetical protein
MEKMTGPERMRHSNHESARSSGELPWRTNLGAGLGLLRHGAKDACHRRCDLEPALRTFPWHGHGDDARGPSAGAFSPPRTATILATCMFRDHEPSPSGPRRPWSGSEARIGIRSLAAVRRVRMRRRVGEEREQRNLERQLARGAYDAPGELQENRAQARRCPPGDRRASRGSAAIRFRSRGFRTRGRV